MAIYSERNANTILTFATDPEGAPMFISKVNGDPGLVGNAVGLSIGGAATVAFDGTVTYDDTGLPPISVGTELADSLIATVSDGVNEVDVAVNLEIFGIADTAATVITFGAFTRAGAGAMPVTGTAITAGNGDGYFQISGGLLSLTTTGQGNVTGTHVLTLDDASTVTVEIAPNRLDARDEAELVTAVKAAEAISDSIDFDVVLRDGAVFGTPKTNLRLENIVMAGTLQDVNAGVANSAYDVDAVASFTGGSITLRSETPLAAEIAGRLRLEGCHGFVVRDLTFTNAALDTDVLSFNKDNFTISNGPSNNLFQLEVKTDSFHPERGVAIIQGNHFTAPPGKAPGHWGSGILAQDSGTVIVQENLFEFVRIGAIGSSLDRWVNIRNLSRDYIVDAFRCFGHDNPITGTSVRWEAIKNVVLGPYDSIDFANEHSDSFQYGTTVDAFPTDVFIHRNHIYGTVNARQYTVGQFKRLIQGFFGNHNGSGQVLRGEVSNNFILCSAFWAIYIDDGENVVVRNNTIINDNVSEIQYDGLEPIINFKSDCVSCICTDNLCGNIQAEAGAGVVILNNMETLDGQALAGSHTYDAVFNGPFTFESGRGWTYVIDTTDAATTRASIDSVFAPKPGGAGDGKGHLS